MYKQIFFENYLDTYKSITFWMSKLRCLMKEEIIEELFGAAISALVENLSREWKLVLICSVILLVCGEKFISLFKLYTFYSSCSDSYLKNSTLRLVVHYNSSRW